MKKNIQQKKPSVAILGYGRFGKVLAELLKKDFTVFIYDKAKSASKTPSFVSLEKALEAQTIFIAVPISACANLIEKIAKKLKPGTTVIDVCSVKVEPVKIMKKFLPKNIDIIATHPMFGPDSIKINSNLKMMMHKVRDQNQQYEFWKHYFAKKKIQIIEMTPKEHDKKAAFSQGITHYLGRILEDMNLKETEIDTTGFKKLLSIKDQTCNDSWQLFCDLQNYNPYSKNMQKKFEAAIKKITKELINSPSPLAGEG